MIIKQFNKYSLKIDFMKTKLILSSLVFILLEINQLKAQTPITLTTPRGTNFTAYVTPEIYTYTDKINWGTAFRAAYPAATEQGTATTTSTYNCHSYAWNKSEGGPTCWIGYYSSSEEDVYWTDQSYIETTEQYASKISYYMDDHSARQTSTQGMYISKWGDKVLMLHARDYGPSPYQMGYRKYYRLNPGIDGTETALCQDQERTFTSNTTISGSTYAWSKDNNLLDYVSGIGTTSYRVKAKSGAGNAYLQLQITTPSGEVATTDYKYVWVGVPILNVTGPGSGYTYHTYTFYANPNSNSIPSSYTWILNPLNGNHVYNYGSYADIAFYNPGNYQVISRAQNTCGTGEYSWKGIGISSGKSYSLSPNPASDNVTITMIENPPLVENGDSSFTDVAITNAQTNEPTTYTIRIYNSQSTLLSTVTRSGKSFNIPLINMRDGIYIIEVSDGKNSYRQILIIKHN